MKELVIIQKQTEKEIIYLQDGMLKEYYKEQEDRKCIEGNIYIGKVTEVLEGMQAAFVDIGEEKNAFLHIRDVLPKKSNITGNKNENLEQYKIKDYIKPGQMLLVQVKKDSSDTKGARVSTNIQVAGRFVVVLPENNFITLSQKIEKNDERNRLKQIVEKVQKQEKIGIIVRTAAQYRSEKEIKEDLENAIKKLKQIQDHFNKEKEKNKPVILRQSETILEKILLDIADYELDKIWVNTENLQKSVEKILVVIQGNVLLPIEVQKQELEKKYDIEKQVQKIANRKIWLNCGGFITIDKTEALTAIDVNSGKFTGKGDLEKNVLKVNKEASIEIARQLRMRDIGGIIIIDYIDMQEDASKEEIVQTLKESLKEDRAKTQIMQFTKLNLLEMTRKHMFKT